MMMALFWGFILLAGYCEYSMWKYVRKYVRRKWFRYIYGGFTGLVWAVTLSCMLYLLTASDTGNGFAQLFGVTLVVFLFNGMGKMAYVFFSYIGCLTGKEHMMRIISWILIGLEAVVIGYGITIGRSGLRIEEETFASVHIPETFNGFRIVLFSDVHTGLLLGRDRILEKLVKTVNSLDADIVVNCGDIVNYDYRELDKSVLDILSRIKSRYGVYAVPGNHDLGVYIRDTVDHDPAGSLEKIVAAQEALGWKVLRDTSIMISNGADTVSVTGLNFPSELIRRSHTRIGEIPELYRAYEGLPPGMFNITLSHAPQAWDAIRSAGWGDVTLSGHVHSLQMKFSAGSWKWSPAAWFYDRWSGAYREDGRLLYINDGVGYAMIPLRIGTRPEVTLITLIRRDE